MNKEDILKKSRLENSDEMVIQIIDKSFRWIYLTMVLVAAFFAFIRGIEDQPIMDLCATVSFSISVGNIYRAYKTNNKYYLIIGFILFAIAIFATIRFFMGY